MIFEIKSPFNLRLEPEFSTGSPVGEPGGTRTEGPSPQLKKTPLEALNFNGEPGGTRTHDTKLKRLVL